MLTIEQQIYNFAMYVLANPSVKIDDLNHDCLVGYVMREIYLVFGKDIEYQI